MPGPRALSCAFGRASAVALAVACGEATPPPADAGADGRAADAGDAPPSGYVPVAPAPAALPAITPCPPGFDEVSIGGVLACEPWPADEPPCPAGTYRFPGDAACAPMGRPCPADGWPEGAPVPTRFVRAGEPAGGDGTRELPFSTIAEALAGAAAGDVVALARGAYDGPISIPAGVSLRGACTTDTRIAVTAPGPVIIVTVLHPGAGLADVTVGPGPFGIRVEGGGQLALERVRIAGATDFGLVAWTDSEVTATDLVIEDIAGDLGIGIIASAPARVDVRRAIVARVRSGAVLARGDGVILDLAETAIADVAANTGSELGVGVSSEDGAIVRVSRSIVERTHAVGAFAAAGELSITESVLRATRTALGGDGALGIAGSRGATVDVSRSTVADGAIGLVGIYGFGSRFRATDVLFHQPAHSPRPLGDLGLGVTISMEASGELTRSAIIDSHGSAVLVTEPGTTATLRDVRIDETHASEEHLAGGRGLTCEAGALCTVERIEVEDSGETGLAAVSGSRIVASDVAIARMRSVPWSGQYGRGLTAQDGGELSAERVRLDECREASVIAIGEGSAIRLVDAEIRRTLPRECATSTCADTGAGTGVVAVTDGYVALESFLVTRNTLAGLQLAWGGEIDASLGEVSFNVVGANVQTDGYDLSRLTDRVVFRENLQNLDATALPVPGAD